MLNASGLMRLGTGAAQRQGWVLIPIALAEGLAQLLGFVPALVFVAIVASRVFAASDPISAVLGAFGALANPGHVLLALVGALLAATGGWLLRTVIQAGVVRQLAAQMGRPAQVSDEAFAQGILGDPARWLSAGAIAGLLRLFAVFAALGCVIAGMAYFTAQPGVLAALLMTVSTALLIVTPLLAAALELGFVRAVLLPEGPAEAVGEGLVLAFRRARDLLPYWYLLVLVDVVIALVLGSFGSTLGAVPAGGGATVLLFGPRAILWLTGVVALAVTSLLRHGLYTALVAESCDLLPVVQSVAVEPPPLPPGPADAEEPQEPTLH